MPGQHSAAISYKMMKTLGDTKVIGPLLVGLGLPIEIAPLRSSTSEIIHLLGFACFFALNCLNISEEIVTVGLNKTCPISTVILLLLLIFSDNSNDPEENPLLPLSPSQRTTLRMI